MPAMQTDHGGAVSLSAFARHVDVTRQAVQKAIRTGRIRQREDGLIDVADGVRDWHANARVVPERASPAPAPASAQPQEAQRAADNPAAPTIARLQQAELALKVEERKVKLDTAKGKLIDRAKAADLVRRLAQEERDAILNWPTRAAPIIAAALGVDPHRLGTLLDEHLRAHLTERGATQIKL